MAEKTKLSDAIKHVTDALSEVQLYLEKMDYNDLPTLLKAFRQIHDARGLMKDQCEIINGMYERLSYEKVPDMLEANGFESVKSGGKNFIISVQVNASIPRDQQEAGFAWLRDVAKTPELITPTVNPKSLSSFVKGYFEANAIWPPENAIKVHKKRYMSIRKA